MICNAYATTSTNPLSADAGISIIDGDSDDEVARETAGLELDGENGSLNFAAADRVLKALGYERIEAWRESGGQWATEVESV